MHNLSICREMISSSGKEKKSDQFPQYCNQEDQPWMDAAQETVLGESMVLIVINFNPPFLHDSIQIFFHVFYNVMI